jgi:hypothetical protein
MEWGEDKEKVSSSLLLFIQLLSFLILVLLLSSVTATGGFNDALDDYQR